MPYRAMTHSHTSTRVLICSQDWQRTVLLVTPVRFPLCQIDTGRVKGPFELPFILLLHLLVLNKLQPHHCFRHLAFDDIV